MRDETPSSPAPQFPRDVAHGWPNYNGPNAQPLEGLGPADCETVVGIAHVTLAGGITYANGRLGEFLGQPVEEIIGQTLWEITHTESTAMSRATFDEAIGRGRTFSFERQFTRPDGSKLWLQVVVSPLRDAAGKMQSLTAVILDIDARKRKDAALFASEARLQAFVEHAAVGLAELSAEGRCLAANRALCAMLGRPCEGLLQMSLAEVVLAEDRAGMAEAFHRVLAERATVVLEHRFLRPEGTTFWAQSTLSHLVPGAGEPPRILVVTADITERRRAERALVESEERLRLIVENAREYAIFSMDRRRQIVSWHSGAERLIGYTEAEILGQPGDVIFTAEDREKGEPEKEMQQALAEGRAADERWHVRKDGTRFWGSGAMMAMHDATGKVIGFVKIFRDETQARKSKQELESSREQLLQALKENKQARAEVEAAAAAKDHFLAVLSHELRTPLTPVLLTLHALRKNRDLSPDLRDAIEMMRRNVAIEARLIDDLLDVTRIARGKLEIARDHVDFHAVIRDAAAVVTPDFQAKPLHFSMELKAGSANVLGDAMRLQQLVWNLLKNAAKFTPRGGSIRLNTTTRGKHLVLEVADSGIGIEPDALPKIFDAFAQASVAVTREYGGLGLGLAIAKATADAHGGKLSATSPGKGKGATFVFEIPTV